MHIRAGQAILSDRLPLARATPVTGLRRRDGTGRVFPGEARTWRLAILPEPAGL